MNLQYQLFKHSHFTVVEIFNAPYCDVPMFRDTQCIPKERIIRTPLGLGLGLPIKHYTPYGLETIDHVMFPLSCLNCAELVDDGDCYKVINKGSEFYIYPNVGKTTITIELPLSNTPDDLLPLLRKACDSERVSKLSVVNMYTNEETDYEHWVMNTPTIADLMYSLVYVGDKVFKVIDDNDQPFREVNKLAVTQVVKEVALLNNYIGSIKAGIKNGGCDRTLGTELTRIVDARETLVQMIIK